MTEEKKPGYAFNYIADVGNGQQFQVTGALPVGATQQEIETEFNKFRNVIEKHRTKSVIPNLQKGIADGELMLENFRDTLAEIDARNDGKKMMPTGEQQARASTLTNMRHHEKELAHKRKVLEEALKELE